MIAHSTRDNLVVDGHILVNKYVAEACPLSFGGPHPLTAHRCWAISMQPSIADCNSRRTRISSTNRNRFGEFAMRALQAIALIEVDLAGTRQPLNPGVRITVEEEYPFHRNSTREFEWGGVEN